jgi:hypothetical protein
MDFSRFTDPNAYKQALAGLLRRGGEVTDFIATAPEKAGQAILEGHEKNKALQAQAFANPNRPFQVTNQQAMGELGDRMLAGPLSVAPVGMTKLIGPQTEAFEIAQRNASLPIEQGGLGLPPNNTAMDRARAMGYETPVFHGTNADIKAFNVEGKGKTSGAGAFLTTNPNAAETYVSASGEGNILPLLMKKDNFLTANARGRNWSDIYTNQLNVKAGKKKYSPDELGLDINSATSTDELGMIAKELGLKGAEIKNVKDLGPNSHVMRAKQYLLEKYNIVPDATWSNVTGKQWDESQKAMKKFYESQKGDIYAVQDPSLIRSKFAAFDPKKSSSPDILAGAIPLGAISQTEEGKQTRKELLEQLLNKQK